VNKKYLTHNQTTNKTNPNNQNNPKPKQKSGTPKTATTTQTKTNIQENSTPQLAETLPEHLGQAASQVKAEN
jgi:hypothetical protein